MINGMTDNILVIGDAHFKDSLSYSEYVQDKRIPEKKEILDFIVESAKDCHSVVFMGDNLNSKNNSSETIRSFTEFVERFNDKQVYILLGNHEKKGNGQSALDFMKEIKKDNWNIMSTPTKIGEFTFLPYMSKVELGVSSDAEASQIVVDKYLTGGSILFAHHVISDTFGNQYGMSSNEFTKEIIIPKQIAESRYNRVIAGHIHHPQEHGKTIITGSVFTDQVGEKEKFIWKVSSDGSEYKKIKLPCREIVKHVWNGDVPMVPLNSIVKCIVDDKKYNVEEIKASLTRFDAYVLLEQYPNERKKIHFDSGMIDFSIESLLEIYAKEKKLDVNALMEGYSMIK